MLKNFDEDWNEISGNELGKATYTGLRPGNITLWYIQPIMIKYGEKYPTN